MKIEVEIDDEGMDDVVRDNLREVCIGALMLRDAEDANNLLKVIDYYSLRQDHVEFLQELKEQFPWFEPESQNLWVKIAERNKKIAELEERNEKLVQDREYWASECWDADEQVRFLNSGLKNTNEERDKLIKECQHLYEDRKFWQDETAKLKKENNRLKDIISADRVYFDYKKYGTI